MKQKKKIYMLVEEFMEHSLPLLFSLPPDMPYHDSYDNLTVCDVLIVQNRMGATRVYSIGMDLHEEEVMRLFKVGLNG